MIASLNNIWVAVAANKHEAILGGFPKVGHDLEHPLSTHPGLVQWGDGSRCWPVDAGLALSHLSSGGNSPTPQRGQSHRSWKRHRRWTQVARFRVTADDASIWADCRARHTSFTMFTVRSKGTQWCSAPIAARPSPEGSPRGYSLCRELDLTFHAAVTGSRLIRGTGQPT